MLKEYLDQKAENRANKASSEENAPMDNQEDKENEHPDKVENKEEVDFCKLSRLEQLKYSSIQRKNKYQKSQPKVNENVRPENYK